MCMAATGSRRVHDVTYLIKMAAPRAVISRLLNHKLEHKPTEKVASVYFLLLFHNYR